MATYIAGKLTRPAIRQALGFLQDRHPDSAITAHVARVATSNDPLAPSEEAPLAQSAGANATTAGIPPQEAGDARQPRSLRDRAQDMAQGRAQKYALGKAQSVIWQQICLPLTAILWVITLIITFFEDRATSSARSTKDSAQHTRDVARVAAAIKARPQAAHIALKPSSGHVSHVLRAHDSRTGMGPAAQLAAAAASSSASSSGSSKPRAIHSVDISKLNRLLSIDATGLTCVVEAACTFRNLVRATTAEHLMPVVVPPFPDMTVGGAFIGGAISSASGWAGSFACTVVEVEVILASGEIVTASREGENSDLFAALAGSYHSIGTVTSLTIQLQKAPRYMHMSYENYNNMDVAMARLQTILDKRSSAPGGPLLGVEALVFSAKNITLAACRGVDHIDTNKHKVLGLAAWWEQSYASYVRSFSTLLANRSIRQAPEKHCIPLADYLWRFEANSFWLTDFAYWLLPWPLTGDTFISRLALGWALRDSNARGTFADDTEMQIKLGQLRVVQDAHIPLAHASRFITWQLGALGVSPLWLCPVQATPSLFLDAAFQHAAPAGATRSVGAGGQSLYYLNVGIYGRPKPDGGRHEPFDAEDVNEELITQVYRAGGRTLLHSHCWHTPQLMAQMYDTQRYESLREKFGASQAYESLTTRVVLREDERAAMRKPYAEPERPLLQQVAKSFVKHKILG